MAGLWVWGCGCGVVGVKAKDAGLDSRGQQGSCHLHVCSCTLGRTAFACYSCEISAVYSIQYIVPR